MKIFRKTTTLLAATAFLAASALFGLLVLWRSVELDGSLFAKGTAAGRGTVFQDRTGRELRFLPDIHGERGRWVPLAEVPEQVRNAFIAAEDERFYRHHGFDIAAITRAAGNNILKRRIVSGASTISQQVVRLIYGQDEHGAPDSTSRARSYIKKIVEIVRSVKMERRLSKEEILEQYLNRVPMGNNLTGIETAARAYFGASVHNLSLSEAALLASLPKAPGKLNPYRGGQDRLVERHNWVLARMAALGMISREAEHQAREQRTAFRPLEFHAAAPHVVDMLLKNGVTDRVVRTTIDLDLQQRVQDMLAAHAARLKHRGATQAAAIVIHNPTMEVLAAAGSLHYSGQDDGFNNGVRALRSAGSALKPFLYALALESGEPATLLLQDTERKYRSREGQYSPLNFDRREYGPVTMRSALGNSLNLSAVKMLERVGEDRFYDMLQRLDLINHPERGPEHYGLGMAIGNPEISPEQLAAAYAMLANRGVYQPVKYLLGGAARGPGTKGKRYVLLPQTAYIITDILSDPTARALTFSRNRMMTNFPFKVAIKTGTSTFYRDLWAAGYTPDYTVVVWVGNFNGSPTNNLSGSTAAVPVFADIMTFLYRQADPVPFKTPKGVKRVKVCGYSGMKPTPFCPSTIDEVFMRGTEPKELCTFHTSATRKRHELNASFAGWLYDKNRTGSAGRYRLSGFGDKLDSVFHDPWEGIAQEREPGIRPRNVSAKTLAVSTEEPEQESVPHHYRLGGEVALGAAPLVSSLDHEVKIIYPLDHDRFVVNRQERNQRIKLQAVVAKSVPYIDWFINGRLLKRTGPPYQTFWQLEEGKYTLTAVTPSNIGYSVQVEVE